MSIVTTPVYHHAEFYNLWQNTPHRAITYLEDALKAEIITPEHAIATIAQTKLNFANKNALFSADLDRLNFLKNHFLCRANSHAPSLISIPLQKATIETMAGIATLRNFAVVNEALDHQSYQSSEKFRLDGQFILNTVTRVLQLMINQDPLPVTHNCKDILTGLANHIPDDDTAAWKDYFTLMIEHKQLIDAAPRNCTYIEGMRIWGTTSYPHNRLCLYIETLFDKSEHPTMDKELNIIIKQNPIAFMNAVLDVSQTVWAGNDNKLSTAKQIFTDCAKSSALFLKGSNFTTTDMVDYTRASRSLTPTFDTAAKIGFLPPEYSESMIKLQHIAQQIVDLQKCVEDACASHSSTVRELKAHVLGC